MKLTPRQKQAVEAAGSVAVTAGAGTGKTAMLASRFVHHVVSDGFSPLEIAAVTFTEKAAAELRSRIRSQLTATVGEERAAEVDAAQISTIHALAARICRDFYDIAGIPADFRMLDEIDAELVVAEMFEDVLGTADPAIVAELGYTWLAEALRSLLSDPAAAGSAFEFVESDYRRQIALERETALTELKLSECWLMAEDVLTRYFGSGDDRLEPIRAGVVRAMDDIGHGQNIAEAAAVIRSARINVGSKANWPEGSLDKVKGCIRDLRDAVAPKGPFANICLEYGPVEVEMYRRLSMLRDVFGYVRREMQQAKLEQRMLDFSDLEHYALSVLQHNEVRDHYAQRWRAILIDEFQDTNPVQERLLRQLSENGARLTIVGDGKQSIYGFRRADPRVFERFRATIANDVVLDRTFRTHDGVVQPLNTVFEHLLGDAHEPLGADRVMPPHDGPFIEAHSFENDEIDVDDLRVAEGRFIAAEIRRMLDDGLQVWDRSIGGTRPVRPSDIVVIGRTRKPLDTYIEHLLEAGIPAVNTGGGYLLETRVAKDVSVLLRFCADQSDDIALAALLRGPFFAVDDLTLFKLAELREKDETWWQLLCRGHSAVDRPFAVVSRLLEAAKTHTAVRLVELADELTGYTAVIANLQQAERRLADWFGCIALLRRFASLGRSDVFGAARYLSDVESIGRAMPRPPIDAGDAVALMTIHAAKGLEWPVVFVPNLSAKRRGDSGSLCFDAEMGVGFKFTWQDLDGRYAAAEPAMHTLIRQRRAADSSLEAARILYVAMTRARDRLYLTSAGKPANDLASMADGLAAAGIPVSTHDGRESQRQAARSVDRVISADQRIQIDAVAPSFDAIPVTGLVEYSICPRRFKYGFVDGHPGVGEGASSGARIIGTLTHAALEYSIDTVDKLRPLSGGASDEALSEAIALACTFRERDEFSSFRLGETEREVSVRLNVGRLTLLGKVDLVGPDYVLDYKTDSEVLAGDHAIQLWVYASALKRPRAVVAYLRHKRLYEYTPDELDAARARAEAAADGLSSARFQGTPSASACKYCSYGPICAERHNE